MFTGIVQSQCPVVSIEDGVGTRRIVTDMGEHAQGLQRGASVAHNGVCLTATDFDGPRVAFDIIDETLQVTNLGEVEVGDLVNIERSLSFGDEVGGHIVSGHVSLTAVVDEIQAEGTNRTMWFSIDEAAMPFLLHKGWVALDGASLTISRVERSANRFAVSLIPETLALTTLGKVEVGDRVNVEFDAQTQTIVTTVRQMLTDPETRDQLLAFASTS